VLKWDPSDAKENSQTGSTSNVFLDGYTLAGARLWRIDLGPNIRAGAHYTQFVVYDFDGDGRAEVAVKTAPGTKDGTGAYLSQGPAASDDDGALYRDSSGYILIGPEYLTVFSGTDGKELDTVNFEPVRPSTAYDYDNKRGDYFLASAAFVSDGASGMAATGRPSILMTRGLLTTETLAAWSWRDGKLARVWLASAPPGNGAHSLMVADTDGDGAQESSGVRRPSPATVRRNARPASASATRCTWAICFPRGPVWRCSWFTRTEPCPGTTYTTHPVAKSS